MSHVYLHRLALSSALFIEAHVTPCQGCRWPYLRELSTLFTYPSSCMICASSATGFRIAPASLFRPYRKSVARFVLYQQHSFMRGESPQMNRSFFSALGDASIAATNR